MYDYSMQTKEIINNLSLKQKIKQLFIVGFEGEEPDNCDVFQTFLKDGLGGVIFFTQNIKTKKQFKKIIQKIKTSALIPPFLSIDQEGGRVERTENIHNGKKYLSAHSAAEKGIDFLKNQTKEMAKELFEYGINMNFAPVLDVNTNDNSPIIGERAFSSKTQEVIDFSKIVIDEHFKQHIIPVGKHFPGHGDAGVDSHLDLPTIDLSMKELEKTHVKPFKESINNKIPAIMVAHVHYPCFDNNKIPASMSKNIIDRYLINKLEFKGIIISDDMVMGAIKGFEPVEACIQAINAGINMFIFRNCDETVTMIVNELEKAIKTGLIKEDVIDNSLNKIFKLKKNL